MRDPSRLTIGILLAALLAPTAPAETAQEPARIAGAEKVQVSLVLIDVVVRDRKDRPVSGLTRDDFELIIDRIPTGPSDIESFEEICQAQPGPSTATAEAAGPAPTPPPGSVAAEPRRIVLYLDFSQLSFAGRRQAMKAARDVVRTGLAPNDQVMLLAYLRGLRLVQGFTSDGAQIAARLDEMLDDKTTLDSNVLDEPQNLHDVVLRPCDPVGTCTGRRALAALFASQEESRARRSLRTIESLMPALAGIKGRKALVLFTDLLRDEPGVEYVVLANSTPSQNGINLQPDLLRLTREANAAGVSIYTVHASGLEDPLNALYRPAGSSAELGPTAEAARVGLDSALALQTTVAVETGGQALQRTNDLGRIIGTAQQDLSCYYLIGYRYQGRGDDQRHSVLLNLRPDASGNARHGLTLRYRPYYTDISSESRRDRLVRSALEAPDLYHGFDISTEAFALAPEDSKRRVLIKTTVPLSALSLVPSSDTTMEGRLVVSGEVAAAGGSGTPACAFNHDVPVKVPRASASGGRLIFETGCLLEPGPYDLSLAVLDPSSHEVGARRTTISVQAAGHERQAFVGDVYLWARDAATVVVAESAEKIGMKGGGDQVFVPRAERRLGKSEEALLSFMFCPADDARPDPDRPVRIQRSLLGEGDAAVASFRDLTIAEAPDADTGCYQIFNTIPANTLGEGVYRFTIQMIGPALGAPLTREAALAVD